jgi:hypothetical protein
MKNQNDPSRRHAAIAARLDRERQEQQARVSALIRTSTRNARAPKPPAVNPRPKQER